MLEALACGAPVVCSDGTALREVAGDAAILVEPESIDAIADGLRTALADPAVREAARQRGPAHAAAYTWDRCAEETVAAYRRILG